VKLLHINAGNLYGGVESLLVTLARQAGLCRDLEPQFAVCFEDRFSVELRAAGAQVHSLGGVRASRVWTVRKARQKLRELLRQACFDIVVCHMPWNHAVFGPEVRRAGIPLVFWQHDPATGTGWLEHWARQTRPDLAISTSRFAARSLSLLFPDVRKEVIYAPVPAPPASVGDAWSFRQGLGVREDQVVILQASRLESWKGHLLLLEALSRIREVPSWVCWIAGGPQRREEERYLARLQAAVNDRGISGRVRFLGQRSDIPQIMASADIFCQPNQGPEPFGLVFVEALRAGLPVVSTAMGGVLEIVDESCGVLTPPGNAAELAQALGQLVTSPEARARLGRAATARAQRLCDPAGQIQLLYDVCAGLCGREVPLSG